MKIQPEVLTAASADSMVEYSLEVVVAFLTTSSLLNKLSVSSYKLHVV
jgi:hypothetical protein